MMKEHPIYKDYFITEDGKVFSNKQGTLKELKQFVNSSGYLNVGIQVEKEKLIEIGNLLNSKKWRVTYANLSDCEY